MMETMTVTNEGSDDGDYADGGSESEEDIDHNDDDNDCGDDDGDVVLDIHLHVCFSFSCAVDVLSSSCSSLPSLSLIYPFLYSR